MSTFFERENEWQKTEQVPILLARASRNFPDVKTRNNIFFYNWTSEIIPFICLGHSGGTQGWLGVGERESNLSCWIHPAAQRTLGKQ